MHIRCLSGIIKTTFLFPGKVIQWIMFMFVPSKRFGGLLQQTMLSRSPIITYLISSMIWFLIFYFLDVVEIFMQIITSYTLSVLKRHFQRYQNNFLQEQIQPSCLTTFLFCFIDLLLNVQSLCLIIQLYYKLVKI